MVPPRVRKKKKNLEKAIDVPDIFLFVLLCHGDAFAIGFQLVLNDLPIGVVFHAECVVQDPGDIVLTGAKKAAND